MLPLFPLNLVAFPAETVSLHIFEPRYKQLIHDCLDHGGPFGIPPFINGSIKEYGSLVNVSQIARVYEDGRMDVRVECSGRYWMMEFFNPVPGKLYSGGEVTLQPLLENAEDVDLDLKEAFLAQLRALFHLLNIEPSLEDTYSDFVSFKFGHKVGLSIDQEYRMLLMDRENDRLRFLTEHVKRTLPSISENENIRKRVKQNGHFQTFDPLTF